MCVVAPLLPVCVRCGTQVVAVAELQVSREAYLAWGWLVVTAVYVAHVVGDACCGC